MKYILYYTTHVYANSHPCFNKSIDHIEEVQCLDNAYAHLLLNVVRYNSIDNNINHITRTYGIWLFNNTYQSSRFRGPLFQQYCSCFVFCIVEN